MKTDRAQKALALLKGLGTTGKRVAESLEKLKIKGTYGYNMCPLANFLRKKIKKCDANVHGDGTIVLGGREMCLPRACKTFVSQFDSGKYPKLEEE